MTNINRRIEKLEEASTNVIIQRCIEKIQEAGRDAEKVKKAIEWLGDHVCPGQPGLDENSLAMLLDALPADYARQVQRELLRIVKKGNTMD